MSHHMLQADEIRLRPAYIDQSCSFERCSLIDRSVGSVHMGLGLCELKRGGRINVHLHSFEESFYILEGAPTLVLDGHTYNLAPGTCGLIPVGVPHAWLGSVDGTARWIDMAAPQPRCHSRDSDTFFLGPPTDCQPQTLDVRDPRSRHLFRLSDGDIVLDNLKVGAALNAPMISPSMSTALLAYSGIAVKMLVDQRLDAQLSSMFMVEYQPGGIAHLHDHPLEESYFILQGEIEAVADDAHYILRPGDVFWTGVGCVHGFHNTSGRPVRWLETQSPQLPARYGYRFSRDWEYVREKLATSDLRNPVAV